MEKILKWGLLSTARINRSLIPGIRASKRSQLVAVGSRDLEKGREFAQEWDIPRIHGTYDDLLADSEVDAIYNPLPNHLHAEWTIKALKAGKHVLLEKPMALSVSEVRAIAEAAQNNKKIVTEAFMYRHHPQTLKVQELIASGAIGKVLFIHGNFTFALKLPADIRWNPDFGGGSIWDIGCYPLSYIRMITGFKPGSVYGAQVKSQSGVDLTFCGSMEYPSGVMAQFYSSFGLPYHTYMEVRGTEGTLSINSPFLPRNATVPLILRQGDAEKKILFPEVELYAGEVEDMEKAALDGQPPRLSLQESEDNIATLVAFLESARNGRVVKL